MAKTKKKTQTQATNDSARYEKAKKKMEELAQKHIDKRKKLAEKYSDVKDIEEAYHEYINKFGR